MDTIRLNKNEINTSNSLWEIIEYGEILDSNLIYLDRIEFGEIGFERKSDWMRFCNKLNNYNITPLRRRFIGDKKEGEFYANMKFNNDQLILTFKEPILVVFGEIGNDYIISKVNKLEGRLSWEWYYLKNSKLDIADICEVILTDIKFIS